MPAEVVRPWYVVVRVNAQLWAHRKTMRTTSGDHALHVASLSNHSNAFAFCPDLLRKSYKPEKEAPEGV